MLSPALLTGFTLTSGKGDLTAKAAGAAADFCVALISGGTILVTVDFVTFLPASIMAASNLASVTVAATFAALFRISSADGGGGGRIVVVAANAACSAAFSASELFVFSNTISFIFESSMVVVMERIPLDVSISYFLVCFALDDDCVCLSDVLGSVAVFVVVFALVVVADVAEEEDFVVAGGDAKT